MTAQWENEYISRTVCSLDGPSSIPSHGGVYFKQFSPAGSQSANPS